MAADLKKNPYNYIEHLEYRNRNKKLKEQEELKRNGHIYKREENFHLFFNGANDIRIRNSRKRSDVEQSKSPANRKVWQAKAVQRRRWDKPETPYMLKETMKEEGYQDLGRRSKDEFEKIDKSDKIEGYLTKSTFKVAGNSLLRPESKKDYSSIASRIESLHPDKKDVILKMLEEFEGQMTDI